MSDLPTPASHSIYIHIDPGTRELLYVGMTRFGHRPTSFTGRIRPHMDRLISLVHAGWKPTQIARVAWSGLTNEAATRLEAQVINHLRPPFNIEYNPDCAYSVTALRLVKFGRGVVA